MNDAHKSTFWQNGAVVRSHDPYGNWCRRTDTPWPLVLVIEPEGVRAEDSEIMYRVKRLYETRKSRPCSPRKD